MDLRAAQQRKTSIRWLMSMHPIESANVQAWHDHIRRAPLALLYKHSPICSLFAAARQEVGRFADANPAVPVYAVDVIAERGLSRRLAEALGVRHASPQVILLGGGSPVWVSSHLGVAAEALGSAVHGAKAGPDPVESTGPASRRDQP